MFVPWSNRSLIYCVVWNAANIWCGEFSSDSFIGFSLLPDYLPLFFFFSNVQLICLRSIAKFPCFQRNPQFPRSREDRPSCDRHTENTTGSLPNPPERIEPLPLGSFLSRTLARRGLTQPLHPHYSPDGTINESNGWEASSVWAERPVRHRIVMEETVHDKDIDTKVHGPSGVQVPHERFVSKNGMIVDVKFYPLTHGDYTLNAKIGQLEIGKYIEVLPDQLGNAEKVLLTGTGLNTAQVNKTNQFLIDTRLSEFARTQCLIEGPGGVETSVESIWPGLFVVKYKPTVPGVFCITVLHGDKRVPGTRRAVCCKGSAGLLNKPPKCRAGLSESFESKIEGQSKRSVSAKIPPRTTLKGQLNCQMNKQSKVTLDVSGNEEGLVELKMFGPSQPQLSFNQKQPGVFDVFYTVSKTGKYEVAAKFRGRNVRIEPFYVYCRDSTTTTPAATSAQHQSTRRALDVSISPHGNHPNILATQSTRTAVPPSISYPKGPTTAAESSSNASLPGSVPIASTRLEVATQLIITTDSNQKRMTAEDVIHACNYISQHVTTFLRGSFWTRLATHFQMKISPSTLKEELPPLLEELVFFFPCTKKEQNSILEKLLDDAKWSKMASARAKHETHLLSIIDKQTQNNKRRADEDISKETPRKRCRP